MIRIDFVEPVTPEWAAWRANAAAATQALVAGGPPYTIDERLYKRQRTAIFAAYHDKCAYCEGRFRLVEAGDVEHYRPKQAVKDAHGFVYVGVGAARHKHPGYYWLAYEPLNLLPSCSLCNRSGKGTLFPVDGFRAAAPGEEAREVPLLLRPNGPDDPEQHFVLDEVLGVLGPRTPQAQATVETFHLNRDELLAARRAAYVGVMNALRVVLTECRNPGPEYADSIALLEAHHAGRAAYALAGRRALADFRGPFRALFATLGPLVGP